MPPMRDADGMGLRQFSFERRGAGLRGPRSEKTPRFVSDPGRTHLMAAEAPSAQIGRRQDLEMVTPEVLAKSASRNVVAL